MKQIKTKFYLLALSISMTACYTFNAAKTSSSLSKLKTFSIATVENEGGGPAYLSVKVTERLRSYFQQNTKLILVKNNADLIIDGKITAYSTTANAIGGDSRATGNRLTISLSLNCTNNANTDESFTNKSFTQFKTYEGDLPSSENSLTDDISDLLVIDVFNAAFTW